MSNKLQSAVGDLDWGYISKRSSKKVNWNLVAAVTFVMCQWRVRWKIYLDICLPIHQWIQVKQFKKTGGSGRHAEGQGNYGLHLLSLLYLCETLNSPIYQSLTREGWKVNPCYLWDHWRLLLMRAGAWDPFCNSLQFWKLHATAGFFIFPLHKGSFC